MKIKINGLEHYVELQGEGPALVFLHGAFADSRLWDPQWRYFSARFRLLRYDLRGHGRTGPSTLETYSMDACADDLAALLAALEVDAPVICGLSWGGSIAQAFAARFPELPRSLVLAGSMVAIDLTLLDKLLCRLFFPHWAMSLAIRLLNVDRFTRFSFLLARLTMGKRMLSWGSQAQDYLEGCMRSMESREYLKIWKAIYAFHRFPLEKIACPTLVLNGEYESRNMLRHTAEILRSVPLSRARVIPQACHAMSLEAPAAFNKVLDEFLQEVLNPQP